MLLFLFVDVVVSSCRSCCFQLSMLLFLIVDVSSCRYCRFWLSMLLFLYRCSVPLLPTHPFSSPRQEVDCRGSCCSQLSTLLFSVVNVVVSLSLFRFFCLFTQNTLQRYNKNSTYASTQLLFTFNYL